MRGRHVLTAVAAVLLVAPMASAAEISGEYLEARTCDVYTGPCFANAEMELAGKEALMAWKVDKGAWNGVELAGQSVALVVNAEGTLGDDGVFGMDAGKTASVILVDEQADARQRKALVDFVKQTAGKLAENVVHVQTVPLKLQNDYLDNRGVFKAGEIAQIETRALTEDDCVCTNEIVYYQPLTDVENFSPAYTKTLRYEGGGLDNQWTLNHVRSAFLATFRR